MDSDLIKLVNKLQDTFANLGEDIAQPSTRETHLDISCVWKGVNWTCPNWPSYVPFQLTSD